MEGNKYITDLYNEINHIRLNPKSYARKLRNYAQCFEDKVLRLPELKNGLLTTEGPVAFEEAASFMDSLPKMTTISLDSNLCLAAQAMANEMSYYSDIKKMNSIDRQGIISEYGKFEGEFGQSTDFGSQSPEFVVMNLIVDDGDHSRKNRTMMFNSNFTKIGLGTCKHSTFRNCTVLMYAVNFLSNSVVNRIMRKPKQVNTEKIEEENKKFEYRDEQMLRDLRDDYQEKNVSPSIQEKVNVYGGNNNYTEDADIELPKGVSKIEKNEKFVIEEGVKMKITKIIKYLDNGEINTQIFKTKV